MGSREDILNKLRAAKAPFPDAPPRPKNYLPVTIVEDTSPDALIERFSMELDRLLGKAFTVNGDDEARACVVDLLRSHNTTHIMSWDFAHIPVTGLESAIREAGIDIVHPAMHDEFRSEIIEQMRDAEVGLTGVDVAIASTGTMVFTTGPGKGRLPTILAPIHIAVVSVDQLLPRLEDWLARQRADGLQKLRGSANFCYISGVSRTADIEMQLITRVHGPGTVQVVIKR